MSPIQTTYNERMEPGAPGLVQGSDHKVITGVVAAEAGIGFGLGVRRDSASEKATLPGAATATFYGVSVRDVTLDPRHEDKYPRYANIGILQRGSIWVQVNGDVAVGGAAYVHATSGALGPAGSDMTEISQSRWLTSAASGGLALLEIDAFHIPANA